MLFVQYAEKGFNEESASAVLFFRAAYLSEKTIHDEYEEMFGNEPGAADKDPEQIKKYLKEVSKKITLDNSETLFDKDSAFTRFDKVLKYSNSDLESVLLRTDDSRFSIDILEYENHESGAYALLDINIYRGDFKVFLEECEDIITDDLSCVYIRNIHIDEKE